MKIPPPRVKKIKDSGSFRDPSGFIYRQNEEIFRHVDGRYLNMYRSLKKSGFFDLMIREKLLIPFKEISTKTKQYQIIKPEMLSFVSYPWEWCFDQIKDAAMTTLKIQKVALDHDLSLKDANNFNIQYHEGNPVLIDTLSFEKYQSGRPWISYRQFCEHFLGPLALMSRKDIHLNKLLLSFLDGIPLETISRLLGWRVVANPGLITHLFLHSLAKTTIKTRDISRSLSLSKKNFYGLIDSLENTIGSLKLTVKRSDWQNYYDSFNYSQQAFNHKKQVISKWVDQIENKTTLWDIGANLGEFSLLLRDKYKTILAIDNDPVVINDLYLKIKRQKINNILPLVQDVTNPTPSAGWLNQERQSLFDRGPAHTVLALAIVHHLALSASIPLELVAKFFSKITQDALIIEFILPSDSQVQGLIHSKNNISHEYSQEVFTKSFCRYFAIRQQVHIQDSKRILFLMKKNNE